MRAEGHDFIIPEGCFWKDVRNAETSGKNDKLNACVQAIAEQNKPLKGIINSVRWNEPAPDGSGNKRIEPEVLIAAMNVLDHVPLDNSNVSPDVLGDAYEYLIKRFADENKGGTTAGQFYTPPEVREIIIRMIQPQPGQSLYDPTTGSAGFLIDGAKHTKEIAGVPNIRLFGQESVWNTWAIANINMHLHGLASMAQVKQGNTIKKPEFLSDDTTGVRQFDRVTANFPFSEENWWLNGKPKLDSKGRAVLKKNGSQQLEYPDKGEFVDPYGRLTYGVPPFSSGDFVFLQHIVASMGENGRAGVVCPQGVLFRGQPAKTEEEDGQNRKPDDEYLIRRGFLEGPLDKDGNPVGECRCLLEAVVVLPDNLFYGTTIPGSILFFNRDKPADRANKVLMVYAARAGWYRETPDQNIILPHDVLRILVQPLAWGDIDEARRILPGHKERLYGEIQDRLDFEQAEIRLRVREEVAERADVKEKLAGENGAGLKKAERDKLEKRLARLDDILAKMETQVREAAERAQKEREAVDAVESELLAMFADPEQRKRYFAIVDVEEIAENDFNLNIPRYVDTFEPDEEIDLAEAAAALEASLHAEKELEERLQGLLSQMQE
jgi:type I restriction enzyme M protein